MALFVSFMLSKAPLAISVLIISSSDTVVRENSGLMLFGQT